MSLSKSATELLRHILEGTVERAADPLEAWIGSSRRFEAFVAANRDKIRKKLRGARDPEAYQDALAELAVAMLFLHDRRAEVAYEPLAAVGGPNPDFAVRFRASTVFYAEVTRLRGAGDSVQKLAAALCTKLKQLPPGAMNVLVFVVPPDPVVAVSEATAEETQSSTVADAARLLKARAERKDDAFFAGRGLSGSRDFFRLYARLSGALVVRTVDSAGAGSGAVAALRAAPKHEGLWLNKEAKHPLTPPVCTYLRGLAAAVGAVSAPGAVMSATLSAGMS